MYIMSFEGVPKIKSSPAYVPQVPEAAPKPVAIPGSPEQVSIETIKREAEALFNGTKTLMELTYKYKQAVIDEIIKQNNRLDSDREYMEEKKEGEKIVIPPKTEILKIMAEFRKVPKTDEAEEKFIELLGELKKNKIFIKLYESYESLIEENPDMTDVYEAKAVQDFVELYPELISE